MNGKQLLSRLLLLALLLAFILPAIVIMALSFHGGEDGVFSFEQYSMLLGERHLIQRFRNSALITCGTLLFQVPLSLAFALFLSRLDRRWRIPLLTALFIMLLLPFQAYMLPVFQLYREIGLYDKQCALILFEAFAPHGPLLLYAFLSGLPDEQWEAARLETSSLSAIVRRVVIPQMLPALAFLLLLSFAEAWNLVEPAVVLLQHDELMPVSVSLNDFHEVSWAGAALYVMPVIMILVPCVPLLRRMAPHQVQDTR